MIKQQCIIDLLDRNNIIAIYVDCHRIGGAAVYHFGSGKGTLDFEGPCVPLIAAISSLAHFKLEDQIGQLVEEDCLCS